MQRDRLVKVGAVGIAVGTLAVALAMVVLFPGCNTKTTTGPETVTTQAPAPVTQAPAPAATPAAAPAAPPTSQFAVDFGPNASWNVKNTSDIRQHYTAYWTDFDSQSISRGSQEGQFNPGDSFSGSFGRGCLQLDITNGSAGDVPFAYAYYDQNGKSVRSIDASIRAACAPPPTCVEPKEHRISYGDEVWNPTILEGKCPVVEDSVAPLNCHQTGTQSKTTYLVCSQNTNETIALCRNVACATPPPPPDVCPNIQGNQAEVPSGYFKDGQGNCVQDVCPNLEGGQATVPNGYFLSNGQCIQDVCPNLEGGQATVPSGYHLEGGQCVKDPTCDEYVALHLQQTAGDKCVNTSGSQDDQCKDVAKAFDTPDHSLDSKQFNGSEAQLNHAHTFSQSATFAFIEDANGCAGANKQVRLFVGPQIGAPVDVQGINGNSVTYCVCK